MYFPFLFIYIYMSIFSLGSHLGRDNTLEKIASCLISSTVMRKYVFLYKHDITPHYYIINVTTPGTLVLLKKGQGVPKGEPDEASLEWSLQDPF